MRRVKIKTWEAMESEFGLMNKSIKCEFYFTPKMEKALPDNRIIEIDRKHFWFPDNDYFSISEDMIEYYISGREL